MQQGWQRYYVAGHEEETCLIAVSLMGWLALFFVPTLLPFENDALWRGRELGYRDPVRPPCIVRGQKAAAGLEHS